MRARPIKTTGQLAKLIEEVVPRTGKIHPATQTFMALRIAVNQENGGTGRAARIHPQAGEAGRTSGDLTFMSLEDRKVKHSFQALARDGRVHDSYPPCGAACEEEIRDNPPSRSAKLRAVEIV